MLRRRPKKIIEYSDLANWLDIATTDLELPARRRISAEIQSHYTDSVATHLADGQSELAAKFMAIAELGDPASAARRFRKSHLTLRESKWIIEREKEAYGPLFTKKSAAYDVLGASAVYLTFSSEKFRIAAIPLLLFFVMARVAPRFIGAPFQSRNLFRKRVALFHLVTDPVFTAVFLSLPYPKKSGLETSAGVIVPLIIMSVILLPLSPAFSVWRKLRNLDDTAPSRQNPAPAA